jgi:hypothetical protein
MQTMKIKPDKQDQYLLRKMKKRLRALRNMNACKMYTTISFKQ